MSKAERFKVSWACEYIWEERRTDAKEAEQKAPEKERAGTTAERSSNGNRHTCYCSKAGLSSFRIIDQERAVLNADTYTWGVTHVNSAEYDACSVSSTITCDRFTLTARRFASACLKVSSATAAVAFSPVKRAAARSPLQLATCKTQCEVL